MDEQIITCPKCGAKIPLSKAITHQIREELSREFEAPMQEKEAELKKLSKELAAKEKSIAEIVDEQLKKERQKIKCEMEKKAKEDIALEIADMQKQLEDSKKRLKETNKKELELRKKARELEEAKENMELEMTRRLDDERQKIKDDLSKTLMEDHQMKDRENEKRINDFKKQIDDLKRKAELGSQQLQGTVQELALEDILKANFPQDEITPVPKGIKGADVIQEVNGKIGRCVGTIIWESKRTKAWQDEWIKKLKKDQRSIKAEIAAIVTETVPNDISDFGLKEDIWISSFNHVVGIATALRITLIQVAGVKMASEGKQEKMGILYDYLTGSQFKQRVECVVETFVTMKNDLDKEKRVMTKHWAKREKEMELVVKNMGGLYGDMQGIIGSSLPEIESLDLKMLTTDETKEKE